MMSFFWILWYWRHKNERKLAQSSCRGKSIGFFSFPWRFITLSNSSYTSEIQLLLCFSVHSDFWKIAACQKKLLFLLQCGCSECNNKDKHPPPWIPCTATLKASLIACGSLRTQGAVALQQQDTRLPQTKKMFSETWWTHQPSEAEAETHSLICVRGSLAEAAGELQFNVLFQHIETV